MDTPDQTVPYGSSIEEATNALMSKSQKQDTGDSATADKEEDEQEEQESAPAKDGEEDLNESEDESTEQESDEDEPSEGDESDEEDYAFTLKDETTGEEVGVSREEARLGYLRQQDYTRKTQGLAEERKVTAALKDELTHQQGQLLEVLKQLHAASDPEMREFSGIDWVQLQRDDPLEYEEKAARYDALKRQRDATVQTFSALQEEQQKAINERLNELRSEQEERLYELAPEFRPEAGGKELQNKLLNLATETYGFKPEELNDIFDARARLVLRDAFKYHELQKKVKLGKANEEKVHKTIKPTTPADKGKQKLEKVRKLQAKAKASGSMQDNLEALMASMSANKQE